MAMGIRKISGMLAKIPWLSRDKPPWEGSVAAIKYPPVAAGIPALPVEAILAGHEETLVKIKHLVEQEADWEQWYKPVIARYAAHVHLLPASEYHHHRGAGGLLAHGLEVGLYTLQQAREKLYGMKLEPKVRRLARPRWQYGCFVAGLCHDVGKPVALMRATLEPAGKGLVDWDGKVWRPYSQDLLSWCRGHGAQRYWVSFKQRQARDHERLAALVLDRVVTDGDKQFLSEYDSELLPAVLSAVHVGLSDENEMAKLVQGADRRSVQEDLGRSNAAQALGQDVGLPVMRIYRDAMLRLVREGVWRVNVAGGRLWYVESGLYLVWPEGGKDIGFLLDRDEAYRGVPRQTQVMAEIMHEWNYVEPTPGGSPFWWVSLEGVTAEKPLLALRIREPRGLLEVLPAPWPGGVRPYESGPEGEPGLKPLGEEEDCRSGGDGTVRQEAPANNGVAPSGASAEVPAAKPSPGLPVQDNQEYVSSGWRTRAWRLLSGGLGGISRVLEGLVPGMVRTRLLEAHAAPAESGREGLVELARIRKLMLALLEDIEQDMATEAASSGELERQTARVLELWELAVWLRQRCEKEGWCFENIVAKPQWVREITALPSRPWPDR